jgi:thiamine biosynthesis lipoprotein
MLSDYDPQSELNRLSRLTDDGPMKQPVAISDDFYLILQHSLDAARLSDGAFDITVGPLTQLQRASRKTGKLPDPAALKDAMSQIGWRYVHLDPIAHRVQLLHERMQLDVGGIAKGFTSELVIKLLRDRGITRALCGAAGDIAMGDAPPGRDDWRIAIQSLKSPDETSDYLRVHNYGVSTSGDTYRSAAVDGKRYSHIIDPRTGLGLTGRIGVSTVAPDAVTADWTATAISILGPEKGIAMVDKIPGAAARVITLNEQGTEKVFESKRLPEFLVPRPKPAPASRP